MPEYPIEQVKNNPLADSLSAPLNIVSAGRNGLCSLYRSAPGLLVRQDELLPPLEGVKDAYRQFLDDLCNDQPLPEASPRTPGGLCAIPYDVAIRFQGDPDSAPPFVTNDVRRVIGPIGAIALRTNPDNQNLWQYYFNAGNPPSIIDVGNFQKAESNVSSFKAFIVSVTPLNPALDNCGSRSPSFPPQPGGGGDYNVPTRYRDRGVDVDVTVNIPPIVIPPGAVSIAPRLEVKIGPNKIIFDGSGARLEISPGISIPITIGGGGTSPNPNSPVTVTPEIDGELLADRFDRIEDILDDIQKCACDDAGLAPLVTTIGTKATSQCVSVPVGRNRFCAIAIDDQPPNRKIQSGGSAPDVIYAGWAWFKAGDYLFERSPIDSEGKLFKNPGGAEAFCYTLYSGFDGTPIILDEPIPPE